jgi:hypothetical protein
MMITRTSSIALLGIGLLALFGCSGVNPPKLPRADPYTPQQIHVDSEQLRRDTAVGAPLVARDEAGLLRLTLPIRSAINKTRYVDRSGAPMSKVGPITKTLQPNTPDSISFNSVRPGAEDFQVDLRYAR